MMKEKQPSMMVKKYYSMLFGGTLSIMVVSIMLMSDTLIAGIFLGENAVSGITLVTPLYSVAAFFGSIFSLGVPIIYSARIGSFNKKDADRVFQTGVLMTIITGIVLFIVISLFGKSFIQISRPSPEVLDAALEYLSFIKYTVLLLPFQALLSECVFADGDETISTISSLTQAIGNVVFSLILSRVIGVRGIALASFLFYLVSLLIDCIHLFRSNNTLRIGLSFSFDTVRDVVRYSAIDAGTYLFIGILVASLNMFVGVRFGSASLVLVSVISLGRNLQLVFDGVGAAITPILTIYLGENCSSGVGKIYHLARKSAVIEGLIVMIFIWTASPYVPTLLQISDPVTAKAAVVGLCIISAASAFVSVLYLVPSYDLLIDRIPLGVFISALRDVLIPAPLAIMLGYFFGIYGVFCGIAIAPILSVLLMRFYLSRKYPEDFPLLLGDKGKIPSFQYDLFLEEHRIVEVRDEIGKMLRDHGYDSKCINRISLLFEEVCMLLKEENEGTEIIAECSMLLLNDRIRMILRDTGKTFDITDSDMKVTSLHSYVVTNIATHISYTKNHLPAMSFNRNVFEIKNQM